MIEKLKPQKINSEKIRMGSVNDGGYVIPVIAINKSDALFTYGVGDDSTFERDYSQKTGKPAFLFDHTIDSPNPNMLENYNLYFHKEGLGINVPNCKDFLEHYNFMEGLDGKPVLLKIDIEGGEFDYFENVDVEKVAAITTGILLEVHWIQLPENRQRLVGILDKLSPYYVLCHVHGNNHANTFELEGHIVPEVLELSFVNRNIAGEYQPDNESYPISGLDSPNNADKEDFNLSFLQSNN